MVLKGHYGQVDTVIGFHKVYDLVKSPYSKGNRSLNVAADVPFKTVLA